MNIEQIKDAFTKHVEKYNIHDDNIKLKYIHSFRVMDLCGKIANDIKLNEEDTYIALVIGLLHDYARFEQWKRYGMYSDVRSIDHADLAVELLFENNEIENFGIDKKYYNIIYDAIKYHNKLNCPENLNERNKLFCKIIRDADKLDILYLFSLPGRIFKDDGSDVSKHVKDDFFNYKPIKMNVKNTKSDSVLLRLALIYDFNFKYSYKHIKDNKIMAMFFNTLENKEKFLTYFKYINDYITKYLEERDVEYVGEEIQSFRSRKK